MVWTVKQSFQFRCRVEKNTLVTDMYTPLTHPLENAAKRGCRTVDGLGMLIHQAIPGFERWFGVKPDVSENCVNC